MYINIKRKYTIRMIEKKQLIQQLIQLDDKSYIYINIKTKYTTFKNDGKILVQILTCLFNYFIIKNRN